jgi:protein-disulfide isomerase
MKKYMFGIIVMVIVLALVGIFMLSKQPKSSESYALDYANQPHLGTSSTGVKIVEFGDYKCPNCKNFGEQIVPLIQKEFVDTGKAQFYFMNDSFIAPDSTRAAKFAETVYQVLGNEAFWKFHEALYQAQPTDSSKEKEDVYTDMFLMNILTSFVKTDLATEVYAAYQNHKGDAGWTTDMKMVKALHLQGTPTIFVNGVKFTGSNMEDLKTMIEKAIPKKEKQS